MGADAIKLKISKLPQNKFKFSLYQENKGMRRSRYS